MALQLVRPDVNVNFIGIRRVAYVVSALLILLGVASLAFKGGPRYGIDFAGGVMIQVKFDKEVEIADIKASLQDLNLPGMVVQSLGLEGDNEYLVRVSATDVHPEELRAQVDSSLSQNMAQAGHQIQRLEMVGPKVGEDLREKALNALFYAVLLIAIYISGRFEQRWMAAAIMAAALALAMYGLDYLGMATGNMAMVAMLLSLVICWRLKLNYALGAVIALIHDVLITVGIFSLLNKEFDLTIVAALLTIVGYSLNDTIIVFDRIRENIRAKIAPAFSETINRSINQTLSRTILTSGTTLIVVVCLYLFGGGVIHDFALALLIGIGVGTYSSIFVASPVLLAFVPQQEPEEAAPAKKAKVSPKG